MDEAESQREQVRYLCRQKRYGEAADLALLLSDSILLFTPCEGLAAMDNLRRVEKK